ncbi:MAG: ORF6N domain-containing protein [Vicinamibacterales bacterium]
MATDKTAESPPILTVRGQRVLLSSDLAGIYGVQARALNQAVARNPDRFPLDFAFRLTRREAEDARRSRSQSVILKRGQNTKYLPLAFTEHGAIMAASVLNSARAIQMSVFVVRAFLRLREWVNGQADLTVRLAELEGRVGRHDHELVGIIIAIRRLIEPTTRTPRRRIGFDTDAPRTEPS